MPSRSELSRGIRVRREKGDKRWQSALPEPWRRLQALIATEPATVEVPHYRYGGAAGVTRENLYRSPSCIVYDRQRSVAISIASRFGSDTAEGFADEKLWYRVSLDAGATWDAERPVVERGGDFGPMHPNRYVWVGRNGFETAGGWIDRMSDGCILFPFCYAPLDEAGRYYNPLKATTYSYVACLIGRWNESGTDVVWEVSEDAKISPAQSSRGVCECAPIELGAAGTILMVSRGGNHPSSGTQKAYKWKTHSTDYGRSWSEYTPFTYDDGGEILSPSSFCNVIRSTKTRKAYWVGNISETMPKGNEPRYPLVIAEIDEAKLALRRDTVTVIDDRGKDDPPGLQLSNFGLIEDPGKGEIVVNLNRTDYTEPPGPTQGVHTYAIQVG